jgi:hypothetical protein
MGLRGSVFITFEEFEAVAAEDHVWFEDRWMVASLCDE